MYYGTIIDRLVYVRVFLNILFVIKNVHYAVMVMVIVLMVLVPVDQNISMELMIVVSVVYKLTQVLYFL